MDHELTLLRRYFFEEMQVLQPQWVEVFASSQLQRDFDLAVTSCGSEFLAPDINEWIDETASGRKMTASLYNRM